MKFKERISNSKPLIGTWVGIAHPDVTEQLSRVGFDWLIMDLEHNGMSVETVIKMMQAMNGSSTLPFVRVSKNCLGQITPVLDAGAAGLIVSMVNTREEAEAVAQACKYPPIGTRGMGPRRACNYGKNYDEYVASANDNIMVAVMIETAKAIENIDDILSVKGIDSAWIGPGDLSCNIGCLGQLNHPDMLKCLEIYLAACKKHDIISCMAYLDTAEKAIEYFDMGFQMAGVADDDGYLASGAEQILSQLKQKKG